MTGVHPAPFRVARGVVVALVGLALALAAHALAGGDVLPGVVTLVPALAVVAGCVVASRHAWTPGRVVAALAAMQLVVHGAAWVTAGSGQIHPRLLALARSPDAHHHDAAAGLTPSMAAGHGLAVLVAALLLSRVDQVVLRMWQLGRTVLGLRPVPFVLGTAPATVCVRPAPAVRRARALLGSPRRGPPVGVASC
jgi:hypothetical protein